LIDALAAAGFEIVERGADAEVSLVDFEADTSLAAAADGVPQPIFALCRDGNAGTIAAARAAGAGSFVVAGEPVELAVERVRCAIATSLPPACPSENALDERDPATDLPTRTSFLRRLETAIARAKDERRSVAVLSIDVNRFRHVASGLTAQSSAELLATLAGRLRDGVRLNDVVARCDPACAAPGFARVSRQEFSLLIEGLARFEDAAKIARRIHDAVETPFQVDGRELYLSLSIGIAGFPGDADEPEALLKCAETAAFSAKQLGPNGIQFFSPALNARAFERLTFESQLRHALERGELHVYYQPRIAIQTGRIVGAEALLRWRHPELGLVSPAQFIPIAEETGLIVPIGDWVLDSACAQAKRWQKLGLASLGVSVNLSPVQFRGSDLHASVVRALQRSGLDPRWLELELTESSLMQNTEVVAATLARLRDIGVTLSIDDFGTGYSSLSYLRRFPIDAIKIDRSFLRDVAADADGAAIVTAIILMAKSLRLRIVAEGVENEPQLSFLKIMQCDEAQGFLYSPPVPAPELEAMLARGTCGVAGAAA
jgi:diguanylate cyclase (GGDEF)-like protein